MRPVRIITAVVLAAAVAVTGCAARSTTADPSAVPAAPVAAAWSTTGTWATKPASNLG
jgi:Flp pilus assembly protein CpaB